MGLKDKIFGDKSSGCGCCGTRIVGLRQVNVGGRSTGIMGLDETFQEYFKKGKKPEDSTGDELVEDLKKLNFIAEGQRRCTKRPSWQSTRGITRPGRDESLEMTDASHNPGPLFQR